jgi:hypothetical protein
MEISRFSISFLFPVFSVVDYPTQYSGSRLGLPEAPVTEMMLPIKSTTVPSTTVPPITVPSTAIEAPPVIPAVPSPSTVESTMAPVMAVDEPPVLSVSAAAAPAVGHRQGRHDSCHNHHNNEDSRNVSKHFNHTDLLLVFCRKKPCDMGVEDSSIRSTVLKYMKG